MKRMVFITIAVFLALTSCNGQTGKKEGNNAVKANEPKTNIKVKKEYDDHGNIVRYDSTYTYVYSNPESNSVSDSIMENFSKHFSKHFSDENFFSDDPFLNDMFAGDSLLKSDFGVKNFFSNDFMLNDQSMEKIFQRMDSVRRHFFRGQVNPPLYQKQ
jgi:hypothetical protein